MSLLRNLFLRRRVDRDLDAEVSAYFDQLVDEKIAAGSTADQARRAARLELGGAEQVKEEVRAVRAGALVEQLMRDVHYGARQLRRSPGFTLVVTLTLALGIGASSAIFSLADALFLRAAPLPNADRVVYVAQARTARPGVSFPLSLADYRYFREHARSFAQLSAHYSGSPLQLVADGEPSSLLGGVVTANYFATLGLEPTIGRFFRAEEDDVAGRDPVAVLSYGLWERRFGRDPNVLGKRIQLNGGDFTVIGIAPRGFETERAGQEALALWIPSAMFRTGYRYCNAFERGCSIVRLTGLLAPGVTLDQAQEELSVLARQLEASYPSTNKGRGVSVMPARGVGPDRQAESRTTVTLLGSTVALMLAISCVNVAGLLVGHGLRRRREVAVRLALGAGRGRLIRQFLTESLMLGAIGGAAGLVVAFWTKELLIAYYGVTYSGMRLALDLSLNWTGLGFTAGLSLVTALAFGLIPALQSSGVDLVSAVKADGPSGGHRRSRTRDALVVVQVALSIVLLVGAGLMIRSVRNIHHGPGFDPSPIVLLRLSPSLINYDVAKAWTFEREANRRIAALPGVVSVSSAAFPPLPDWGDAASLWLPGQEAPDRSAAFLARTNRVGPRYFETLGLRLIEGREFTDRDDRNAPPVVIVNQAVASRFWPDGIVVGRTLVVDGVASEVIGVVRNAQFRSIADGPEPFVYASYWQQDRTRPFNGDSRTHVRVAGDPAAMLPLLRRAIASVDPNVPISEELPLVNRLDFHFRHVRAVGSMLITLGSFAVFLSAIALWAVLASAVRQRRREIAIRIALGAHRSTVSGMVVRQGLSLAAVGAGVGLATATALTGVLQKLLFGVGATDPLTLAGAIGLLGTVSLIACYLPAWRAARIDPMVVLRHE